MKQLVPVVLLAVFLAAVFSSSLAAQRPQLFQTQQQHFGMNVSYLKQPAPNSGIVLDANNGFFDMEAFRAEGQRAAPEDEKALISAHFSHLVAHSPSGTARWHVWLPATGQVQIDVAMDVPEIETSAVWKVSLASESHGGQTQAFVPAQPKPLTFSVNASGKYTVELKRVSTQATPNTEIKQLKLSGPATANAGILRARWRPAAIHAQYSSSTCPETQLWVFESQNASHQDRYSPMTTQFGYFGASFAADGKAAGSVNFSMWAANRKATQAPPLTTMPHLLATGNVDADFGGFGHEGSGVKIRNWEPYKHRPKSVIQALRVQADGDWNTFSGYLFDQRSQNWVLYAIGRKAKEQSNRRKKESDTALRPASFCEIPGPPARQRSGDLARTVRRRGWFYGPKIDGSDNRWHLVDRQATRPNEQPANKSIGTADGWFTMMTGGMAMVKTPTSVRLANSDGFIPSYLQPNKTAQLFAGPVGFGKSQTTSVNGNSATVSYDFNSSGTNAEAVLHYGPQDCLTFVNRELHGTEKKGVSNEMLSADRTWEKSTPKQLVRGNKVTFNLKQLHPRTKYFYRVLVTNEEGKSWAFESGSFQTK